MAGEIDGDPDEISFVRGPLKLMGLRCTLQGWLVLSPLGPSHTQAVTAGEGAVDCRDLKVKARSLSQQCRGPIWLITIAHSDMRRGWVPAVGHTFPNT